MFTLLDYNDHILFYSNSMLTPIICVIFVDLLLLFYMLVFDYDLISLKQELLI